MALLTRNVFIDTESFVAAGLHFTGAAMESFIEVAGRGDLNHLMTTVTVKEVKGKIDASIKEGLAQVLEFRRKARMLKDSPDAVIKGLFAKFENEAVLSQAQQVFQEFIDDSGATIVNLGKVDSDEVFDRYFNEQAPFKAGKKKAEFPDAFSMLAIRSHLAEQEHCYVISKDQDLISFCESEKRFVNLPDLAKLLDVFNSHDTERAAAIKAYLSENIQRIRDEIAAEVNSAEFYNSSTWDDAEVTDHRVIGVEDFEPDIVSIDDDECVVIFDVSVIYEVDVSGPDFINGYYDREDDRMYPAGTVTRSEQSSVQVSVELHLGFTVEDHKFKVDDMDLAVTDIFGGVEVSVEESPNSYDDHR